MADADAIYTDVWTSMGQEKEVQDRLRAFRAYQVNNQVVSLAKSDAVVMHCLPAHRGEEITHEVLGKLAVRRLRSSGESPPCAEGGDGLAAKWVQGSRFKFKKNTGSRGSKKSR